MTAVAATPDQGVWRKPTRSVIIHAILFVASLVMLYPLLWMLSASLKPQEEIFGNSSLIPSSISFEGYVRGWTGLTVNFGTFFLNSFLIAALSIAGNLIACSLTALRPSGPSVRM